MGEIKKEVIEAYALENAIKHEGIANSKAVLAGLFAEGLEKSEIKNYMLKINEIVKKVNSQTLNQQENQFKKISYLTSKRDIRDCYKGR